MTTVVTPWGRSAAASPLLFDCGIGYEIQSQYIHAQADAVSQCTYVKGMGHDPEHRRFPFYSGLEELPRMAWDVPWVEHNKVEGKPYFVYETQIDNRTKYRAEYPLRIAALGAIQDWDIVNWHDYGGGDDSAKAKPFDGMLGVGHSSNLHYKNDEVQNSAMRAAAEIFKNSAVQAAPTPTTFVYGRKALYDPVSMDYGMSYGKLGEQMLPTTYRHGVRIRIDPTLDDHPEDPVFKGDKKLWEQLKNQGGIAIGESFKPRVYESNPIRPTPQIEYDWQQGHLKLDAPAAMAYTGFLGNLAKPEVRFANGAFIHDVEVKNPAGMPYPVTKDELYVAITLASCDGQPLGSTKRAVLSASKPPAPGAVDAKALDCRSAELTWGAAPAAPLGLSHYLIRRNGQLLAGADKPGYIDHNLDEKTAYSYEISAVDQRGGISTPVKASVITPADNVAPTLVTAAIWPSDLTCVTLDFDEMMDDKSASSAGSYALTPAVAISKATLSRSGTRVILTTAKPLADGQTYTLTCTGLKDRSAAGNALAKPTTEFAAWEQGGGLRLEFWNDLGDFAGKPTHSTKETLVDHWWGDGSPAPGVIAGKFCARWSGILRPRISGEYRFRTGVVRQCRIMLDGKIVHDEWTSGRNEWTDSPPLSLEAGKRYTLIFEMRAVDGQAGARLKWHVPGKGEQFLQDDCLFLPSAR